MTLRLPLAGGLLAVLLLAGCADDPVNPEFEAAQRRTSGEGGAAVAEPPRPTGAGGYEDDLGAPPPITKKDTSGGKVHWSAGGAKTAPKPTPQVDVAKLQDGDALPGGDLNAFFPPQEGDYDMVAKQEKKGFALYEVRRGGETLGELSVTDMRNNPKGAEKFNGSAMQVAGYPAAQDGSKGTTLLVAGRFQVKVRSPGGQLSEDDRKAWLQKFDLDGLAGLAN